MLEDADPFGIADEEVGEPRALAPGINLPQDAVRLEKTVAVEIQKVAEILRAAGITTLAPVLDDDGKPIINNAGEPVMREVAKYGLHSLRHACASLWIESGMNAKRIQTLMGHRNIQTTLNVYGHLFERAEMATQVRTSVLTCMRRESCGDSVAVST